MQVPFDSTTATVDDGERTVAHDYATWTRTVG
jgi:hypothetical protein